MKKIIMTYFKLQTLDCDKIEIKLRNVILF